MKFLQKITFIFLISLLSFFNTYAEDEIVEESNEEVFAIDSIETISFNEVKLIFNSNLEDTIDASREFRVVNRNDVLDELEVIDTVLDIEDNKNLFITFDKDAESNVEYELTVLDLRDNSGRNIEFGIEGIAFFIMPENFEENVVIEEEISEEEMDLNSAAEVEEPSNEIIEELPEEIPEELIEEEIVEEIIEELVDEEENDLNAAGVSEEGEGLLTGMDMREDDIEKNTISESKKVGALPQTGPGTIFILIFAIILGTLFFVFRLKRS